jgi:putative Holliday junction resolvase
MRIIASGLTTVKTNDLMNWLKDFLSEKDVDTMVVGQPIQLDNTMAELEHHIKGFLKRFSAEFPEVKIERQDERYTSAMAESSIRELASSRKTKHDKALIDEVSATLILQSYMEKKI